MNLLDLIIIFVLLISLLIGLFRGFVSEVLSLVAWVLSLWAAYAHAPAAAALFAAYISQQLLQLIAGFTAIFLLTLIATSFAGHVVRRFVLFGGVGGIDRSLGMLFGVARGVALIAIFILAAHFAGMSAQAWWRQSLLLAYFMPAADGLLALLPADIAHYFLEREAPL